MHRSVASYHSEFLKLYFNTPDEDDHILTVFDYGEERAINQKAIPLFARLSYSRRIEDTNSKLDSDIGTLFSLLILIDKWQAPILHDIVIKAIFDGCCTLKEIPTFVVHNVYKFTDVGDVTRRLLAHIVGVQLDHKHYADQATTLKYPAEFLIDVVKALQDVVSGDMSKKFDHTQFPFTKRTVCLQANTKTLSAAEASTICNSITMVILAETKTKNRTILHTAEEQMKDLPEVEYISPRFSINIKRILTLCREDALDSDLVKITVEGEAFYIHNYACSRSPRFDKAFNGQFLESKTRTLDLGDETTKEAFQLCILWMYTDSVTDPRVKHSIRACDLYDCALLADGLLLPELQNTIIRKILKDSSENYSLPATSLVTRVYENTLPNYFARKFLVDLVLAKMDGKSLCDVYFNSKYPLEFIDDIVKGRQRIKYGDELDIEKYMTDISRSGEQAVGRPKE